MTRRPREDWPWPSRPRRMSCARGEDHPNGAVDLVEALLCVTGADIADVERRYEVYTGRSARRNGLTRRC